VKKGAGVDFILLFVTFLLLSVGLITVFSASPTVAMRYGDPYYFIKRQLFYLVLGLLAMRWATSIDLSVLKRWTPAAFGASLLLLLAVLVPGVGQKISGSSRWLNLWIFSFQPSELVKLTYILFLALILANFKERVQNFVHGLLPIVLMTLIVLGAVVLEPDLGTAVVISVFVFIMLFAAGVQHIYLAGAAILGLGAVVTLSFTSAYRFRRLLGYLRPWDDPLNVGFHVIQSLLAVGSGGLWGLGLGGSKQKFYYLPQQFTDFIFAIFCEEMGFIGAILVLILFFVFISRGLRIARGAFDYYHSLLVVGLVAWIGVQAVINIFVVLGLLPTTGIPLPFVSYGGTSLITLLFAVGLILNVSAQRKKES
jgi:cell division protein FtsW